MADLNNTGKGSPRTSIAAKFQNGPLDSLPPIGVFWDIENCQVPKDKSVTALVQSIREKFFHGHREAEFLCVCDIRKENKDIIHELNLAQVTVVHINAISKNAADDKLKQCMRRFVDTHGMPATILLISGDVNFATHLSDFRHRDNIYIKLVHNNYAPEPLLVCAHEHYNFHELIMNLPPRNTLKGSCNRCELLVSDLPPERDPKQIKNKLRQLSNNCGGKVLSISGSTAKLCFPSAEAAQRAKKRMDGEEVFGRKITVSYFHPSTSGEDFPDVPLKPYQSGQKKYKNTRRQCASSSSSCNSSPVTQSGECEKLVIPIERFDFPPPPDLSSDDCPKRETKQKYSEAHHKSRRAEEERYHKLHWDQRNKDISPGPQQNRDLDMGNKSMSQKNVGRVSPFVMVDGSAKSNYQFTSVPRPDPSLHCQRNSVNTVADGYNRSLSASPYHFNGFSSNSSLFFSPLPTGTEYQSEIRWNSPTAPILSDPTHPIGRASPIVPTCPSPVEMLITNLDQSFEANEMKKILLSVFREHVMVLHISMLLQPDGSLKAVVKVPSLQDAQYAISQLHRRKIGYKRLLISYASSDRAPPLHILRSEVVALLMDIPSKRLPLFKFRELYEKRYHRSISMSELYKMREAISIIDSATGRMVCLNADFRCTPSPTDSEGSQEVQQILEKPYCEHHFQIVESQGWAEQISVYPLPNVHISLKTLAPRVHTLLDTHQGSLPLNSFCSCYKAEFGPLPLVESLEDKFKLSRESTNKIDLYPHDAQDENHIGDTISNHQKGVPLEHLIACIPGVQITKSVLAIKKIQWLENKPVDQDIRSISPALAGQLTLFCRETVDLLKSQPLCSIPFNKFIPAYHHHFGRQCRVADYGFIKLIDLLESIPHSVQILGQGQNRILTLTHRAQVKRFAADLLRILKSRASKQVTLSELPVIYEQCINKPFDICDYGVCEITDMLAEISENTIVIISSAEETFIGIPKREQTSEEIERTKHFAKEVLELLSHTPTCSMPFGKFIPAYHHHFNKQCCVADYGFSKLIELFEVIPDVLEVSGVGEDKILHLVEKEKLKVLTDRLVSIIRSSPQQSLPLSSLFSMYSHQHGCTLRCQDFGASDMPELISKLRNSLKMQSNGDKPVVTVVNQGFTRTVALRVKHLLMENSDGKEDINELQRKYKERFENQINILSIQMDLEDVQIQDNFVKLSPLLMTCRDILLLLHEHGGQLPLQNFEIIFLQRFGVPCCPAQYGFPSMAAMLQSQPDYFLIRGRRSKRILTFNKETTGSALPTIATHCISDCEIKPIQAKVEENEQMKFQTKTSVADKIHSEELLQMRNSPVDLLSEPIPSGVPSPEIQPEKQCFPDKDLMGFESPLPSAQDVITGTVDKERQQLKTPPLCQTSSAVIYPSTAIISQSSPASIEADVLRALICNTTSHSQSFSAPPSYTHFAVPLSHFQAISAPSCLSPNYQAIFQSPPSMTYFLSNAPLAQSYGTPPPTTVSSLPIIAQSPGISFHESLCSSGSSLPLGATSSPIVPILPGGLNLSNTTSFISVQNPLSLQTEPFHKNLQRVSENSIFSSGNTKVDSLSYEDLTRMSSMSLDRESFPSTQSTPTRGSTRSRPRSRIAAQFSNPIEQKDQA